MIPILCDKQENIVFDDTECPGCEKNLDGRAGIKFMYRGIVLQVLGRNRELAVELVMCPLCDTIFVLQIGGWDWRAWEIDDRLFCEKVR